MPPDEFNARAHQPTRHFRWVLAGGVLDHAANMIFDAVKVDGYATRLWDVELGDYASDCIALQCAGFLGMKAESQSDRWAILAEALLAGVHIRRHTEDWFAIPYNALLNTTGERDIAEFGASSHALRVFENGPLHGMAGSIAESAGEIIRSYAIKSAPGRYKKSSKTVDLDVLNADLYAALVLDTAFRFSGRDILRGEVNEAVRHVIQRFGAHREDRWAYSESDDGRQVLGYSFAYQSTIVGWGWILAPSLEPALGEEWTDVLVKAAGALQQDKDIGPCEETEAATWARAWHNVWEIRLAFGSEWALELSEFGLGKVGNHPISDTTELSRAFQVDVRVREGRNPVSSSLRKVSNFCAVVVGLDEIKANPSIFHSN